MELIDKDLKPQEQSPIDKINATLKELGSTAKWKRAPERIEGTEVLKDKTVAMVDDERGVLEAFVPDLMVATDGKATFIRYGGQSVEDLIKQIWQTKADLVLLDYHLSEMLKGYEITRALIDAGFAGSVVGFSSDNDAKRKFKEAGALGSVDKEAGFPKSSVSKLAELFLISEESY